MSGLAFDPPTKPRAQSGAGVSFSLSKPGAAPPPHFRPNPAISRRAGSLGSLAGLNNSRSHPIEEYGQLEQLLADPRRPVVVGTHRLCVAGRSRHKEQAYSPRSRFPAPVHGTIEPFCCLQRPYTAPKAIMVASPDRTLSSSHGTLVGDIMWLAVIAFVFAIITGALG